MVYRMPVNHAASKEKRRYGNIFVEFLIVY
jgi:hypothetical protein